MGYYIVDIYYIFSILCILYYELDIMYVFIPQSDR